MSSFGSEAFPKNSTQKAGSNENDWNEEEWGMDAPAAEAGMSTDTTPSLDLLGSAAELPTPVVKSRTAASRVEDLIVNQKQLHQLNPDTTTAHTEGLAMEFHPGWQCHFLKYSSAAPGDHRWGDRYERAPNATLS